MSSDPSSLEEYGKQMILEEKCQFPPTEINHDLNPPLTTSLTSNRFFKGIYATSLGECQNNSMYNSSFRLKNDMNMVSYIFEPLNIDDIKSIPTRDDHTDVIDVRTNGTISACTIQGFNKPYTNSVFELFKDSDDKYFEDIFFVIDTGDNLVQLLAGLTPPSKINIHQIHSMVTLADSAPKTIPNSPKYKKNNKLVILHSWYYSEPIIIDHEDPLFISSFRIENSRAAGYDSITNWEIKQKWTLPAVAGQTTYINSVSNAKKDNNKNVVKSYLETYVIPKIDYAFSDKDKIHGSHFIQRKRSGDYLQVLFAEKLPGLMKYDPSGRFELKNTPYDPLPFSYIRDKYTVNQFRQRTFFITGDWPAVCWAIWNRVNTIMVFKHPKNIEECCILKFSFE